MLEIPKQIQAAYLGDEPIWQRSNAAAMPMPAQMQTSAKLMIEPPAGIIGQASELEGD